MSERICSGALSRGGGDGCYTSYHLLGGIGERPRNTGRPRGTVSVSPLPCAPDCTTRSTKAAGGGETPGLAIILVFFHHILPPPPSVAALQPGEQLHSAQLRVAAYRAILDRLSVTFGPDHPTVQGIAKSIATAEAERDFWRLQVAASKPSSDSN